MKILINAYACSPGMGSEPGMAWNWVSNLAKSCGIIVSKKRRLSCMIDVWYAGFNASEFFAIKTKMSVAAES